MCAETVRQMSLTYQGDRADAFLHQGLRSGMPGCAIARERIDNSVAATCESMPYRSMLTVVVYLTEYRGHSMWCDALPMMLPHQAEGMIGIYDRSHRWKCTLEGPLHSVQFHFPSRGWMTSSATLKGKGCCCWVMRRRDCRCMTQF